jgi:flavin reductase (NADH)
MSGDCRSDFRSDFREAMAHLPAAVHILTTDGPGGRCGITLSAVCSVTDRPPTVLACVNRSSAMHDVFAANGTVCLNVLDGEQEELARHFSGATRVPMAERFGWDVWDDAEPEVPALRDALVSLVGRIEHSVPSGSHSVLFITIDRIALRRERESGLVYFNRGFHRLTAGGPRP